MRVSLLITTTGDAGGSCGDAACTREYLAYTRANEAVAGAAVLGYSLGEGWGLLPTELEQKVFPERIQRC